MSRRELLERLATLGFGLAAALAAVVPSLWAVVGLARHPTVGTGDEFIGLGPLQSFPEHEPQAVALRGTLRDAWASQEGVALGGVWVVRNAGGVAVFSAICPHLGCSVGYDPAGARFVCPCHASIFGPDGSVQSGPAPRGLDPLPTRISERGEVACRYLRFKPGLQNRVPT
jgi:menaquinol-cytochrome c reductase iron-sulfur subunit